MKYADTIEYASQVRWDKATGGIIEYDNYDDSSFDTPTEFDGKGSAPCPDQLFLASIGGCLMNTFTHYGKRLDLTFDDVYISLHASLSLHREGYRFDCIKAKIRIQAPEEYTELAERCGKLAKNYCHITRSIESAIPVDVDIEVDSKSLCIYP